MALWAWSVFDNLSVVSPCGGSVATHCCFLYTFQLTACLHGSVALLYSDVYCSTFTSRCSHTCWTTAGKLALPASGAQTWGLRDAASSADWASFEGLLACVWMRPLKPDTEISNKAKRGFMKEVLLPKVARIYSWQTWSSLDFLEFVPWVSLR